MDLVFGVDASDLCEDDRAVCFIGEECGRGGGPGGSAKEWEAVAAAGGSLIADDS